MARGRTRGGFRGNARRARSFQGPYKRQNQQRPFAGRNKRKQVSAEDLDKDIEQYWGEKVVAEHLDKEMDEYWEKTKKEEPAAKE